MTNTFRRSSRFSLTGSAAAKSARYFVPNQASVRPVFRGAGERLRTRMTIGDRPTVKALHIAPRTKMGQAASAIYITTADGAAGYESNSPVQPARCRADNPRRPAGSGWSVGHLRARACGSVMNHHLISLTVCRSQQRVPVRQELFRRGRKAMLR
jgi:hypothetical protein